MMLLVLQGMAALAPQDHWLFGVELLVLNLATLSFPISAAVILPKKKVHIPVLRIATSISCALVAGLGAALVLVEWRWAIHVIALANCISMFVLVINAWSLMLGAWRSEVASNAR
jgi:hypothetical protein